MIIVAGGDSFVWGSELADSPHGGPDGHSRKTYAALLSDAQYICCAYPGNSNKDIVYSTIKCCDLLDEPFGVLISWTWPTRDNKLDSDDEILELQNYLETNNIPYMFTCADNCIVTDNKQINWDRWFLFPIIKNSGWHPNEDPRGFYQWALEHKYELAPKDKHPLEHAHYDAALLMKGKFNELVKKNLQQNSIRNPLPQKA